MFPIKKVFLKNSQNSQENMCVGVSFLRKLQASNNPHWNTHLHLDETENHPYVVYCVKSVRIRSYSGPHFSCIRTEYGEICISSYLVRMRENADQNNFKYWHFSCSVLNASPNLPNNMIVSVICTSIFLFSSASILQFLSNIKSISSTSPFMLEKIPSWIDHAWLFDDLTGLLDFYFFLPETCISNRGSAAGHCLKIWLQIFWTLDTFPGNL